MAGRRGGLPALVLPAERVDAWRLRRQRVHPDGPRLAGAESVARELVGVQAQVLSAAALAVALRMRRGTVGATPRALVARRLVRTWAMRGTLHVFAADDLPTIVAALGRRETWRNPVWLRYFELTESQMESVIEAIGQVLADGRPRDRRELDDEVSALVGRPLGARLQSSWGTFLKPAAYRGYLVQASSDAAGVRYVRPDRWLDHWPKVDSNRALPEVFGRYFAAYGPASERDLMRWWGAAQVKLVRPTIEEIREQLVEVEVDGTPGLMPAMEAAAIARAAPLKGDEVLLLGAFDPLILGTGLRDRLIPTRHVKRVSRAAGWISPVVLIGGRVGGVWTHTAARTRIELTVEPFGRPSKATRSAIIAAAERIGAAHGMPASVVFGRVFQSATPAALTDD
ncbi:MAG TPA: winged helix DNA-binding domain-containing protein [Candidatus Limnocylindrales bacterium]|jgi:hypothetical protein